MKQQPGCCWPGTDLGQARDKLGTGLGQACERQTCFFCFWRVNSGYNADLLRGCERASGCESRISCASVGWKMQLPCYSSIATHTHTCAQYEIWHICAYMLSRCALCDEVDMNFWHNKTVAKLHSIFPLGCDRYLTGGLPKETLLEGDPLITNSLLQLGIFPSSTPQITASQNHLDVSYINRINPTNVELLLIKINFPLQLIAQCC